MTTMLDVILLKMILLTISSQGYSIVHDGVLVVADPKVVNDHSANLPWRMIVMSCNGWC